MKLKLLLCLMILAILFQSFDRINKNIIKSNPPLIVSQISYDTRNDGYRALVVANTGNKSIAIKKITVNSGRIPSAVHLGLNYGGNLSYGVFLDQTNQDTVWHKIDEKTIEPESGKSSSDKVNHYVIRVADDQPLDTVEIHYIYKKVTFFETFSVVNE